LKDARGTQVEKQRKVSDIADGVTNSVCHKLLHTQTAVLLAH